MAHRQLPNADSEEMGLLVDRWLYAYRSEGAQPGQIQRLAERLAEATTLTDPSSDPVWRDFLAFVDNLPADKAP